MPVVQATILEGRTQEKKEAFCYDVAKAASTHLGVKIEQVRVVLYEVPAEHWTVGGVSRAVLDKQKTTQ